MSENSPLLELPYLQPAQAQKHVTHNEALRMLDASVQLSVPGPGESAPPADPQEGQRLLVASGATGDWQGQDNAVTVFVDGAWQFFFPAVGWTAWLRDAGTWVAFDGSGWREMAPGLWGVNATADAQTRLAVAAEGTLFTHDGPITGCGSTRPRRATPRRCCSRPAIRAGRRWGSPGMTALRSS